MTLRVATQKSVNTVFVRLMQDVDPYEVVDLANKLGLGIRPIDPADRRQRPVDRTRVA